MRKQLRLDPVTKYAQDVVDGKKDACQAEINACKRHLDDI